mgnify:CR=1 FL=1
MIKSNTWINYAIYIDNILIITINKDTGIHVYKSGIVGEALRYKQKKCHEDELIFLSRNLDLLISVILNTDETNNGVTGIY